MALPDTALNKNMVAVVRSKRSNHSETIFTNKMYGNTNLYELSCKIYENLYMENYKNSVMKVSSAVGCIYSAIQVLTNEEMAAKALDASVSMITKYEEYMRANNG